MTRFLGSLLLILSVICACGVSADADPILDEYDIYIDFLSQHTWNRARIYNFEVKSIVINQVTSTRGMNRLNAEPWVIRDLVRKNLPSLRQSTIESFESRNMEPVELQASKFIGHNVTIITKEEKSQIFSSNIKGTSQWPGFYERFPDTQGILSLSRVGVSTDGMQALLYYGNVSAGCGGVGEIVLLEKSENQWTIVKVLGVWKS